jgi:cytochrome c-type biogenesis protein CcmH
VRRAALVAVMLAIASVAPVARAAPPPRASLPDIEDEVMCVLCKVPLNVADAPQADAERAYIRTLIRRGETKSQIKRALVGQYGPAVLATPRGEGFDLAAWLVPAAVVLAALALVATLLPRWRRARGGPAPAAAGPSLDPADARRLEEDLARHDG